MKKLLFLATALSLISGSYAQSYLWAKTIGGSYTDFATSITTDVSGNVFSTGSFQYNVDFDPGAGTFNLISTGSTYAPDVFVYKLDASGNFVWAKKMGGPLNDYPNSITTDAAGNVYTTGYFQDTSDFNPGAGVFDLISASSAYDIFISKLDASGNFVWAKAIGTTSTDIGMSIAVDAVGNVYTVGYFNGVVDFDPGVGVFNLTSAGGQEVFISKLDASGNFVWAKSLGGTSNDVARSIMIDASGNLFIIGHFNGTADLDPGAGVFNLTSAGFADIFICKLDASGNFIWAKAMGGSSVDSGQSLVLDASGNIFTTGYFYGTADFDPGSGTFSLTSKNDSFGPTADVFVSKLDATGNFVWAKTIGGTDSEEGYSIDTDVSGNVYTTGSFDGTVDFDPGVGTINLTSSGAHDIFISKLDAAGNFAWVKTMGGTDNDAGYALNVDASGNVYTTGYYEAMVDFDPGPGTFNLSSNGGNEIFVHKMDNLVSVPELNMQNACSVFPNPNSGHFKIKFAENLHGWKLKVINCKGQEVFAKTCENTNVLEVEIDQPGGIYFLRLENERGNFEVIKLIKK